jgi:hypothetical protein
MNWSSDSALPGSQTWTWMARLLPYIDQGPLARQYNIPDGTMGAATAGISAVIPAFVCPADSKAAPATDWRNIPGVDLGPTSYRGVSGSNWGYNSGNTFTTAFPVSDPVKAQDGLDNGNGIFYRSDGKRRLRLNQITDGLANTLMIGESSHTWDQHCGGWAYPNYVHGTCAIPLNYADPGNDYTNWPNRYSFKSYHAGGGLFCFADGSVHFVQEGINIDTYRALSTIANKDLVNTIDF